MIELNCRLARMDETDMPDWLTAAPERIAETFRHFSRDDIRLLVDGTRLAKPRTSGRAGVEAYDLHRATSRVAANVAPPIQNITILFASRYAHARYANVLGIMFDRGFATDDDPSGSEEFMRIPREGCAVFLDTIRELRHQDDLFERETFFTTVHELGHVFNLQHLSGSNFMASSPLGAPFELDHHVFTAGQCDSLARCSTSPQVRPGGSPFGDSGAEAHVNVPLHSRPDRFGLALTLSLATHRFWRFEPVELDVELSVLRGVDRIFTVPDQLDPGYERFVIWIEDPAGERRRYRSPRRYCSARATRVIRPAQPFRRDLSLFGEAGGYTFTAPGIYRIWAEFSVARALKLRSNTLELLVEPPAATGFYDAVSKLLTRRDIAKLLYHRLLRTSPGALAPLDNFLNEASRWEGTGRIEYALGRTLITEARRRAVSAPQRASALKDKGTSLLARAHDRDGLGINQRRHIIEILNDPDGEGRAA